MKLWTYTYRNVFLSNPLFFVVWLVLSLVSCIVFPLAVALEFWKEIESNRLLAFKLYPHLLLYPPLCLWIALWATGYCIVLSWDRITDTDEIGTGAPVSPALLSSICVLLVLVLTLAFLYREATSGPLLLIEISPTASAQLPSAEQAPTTTAPTTRSAIGATTGGSQVTISAKQTKADELFDMASELVKSPPPPNSKGESIWPTTQQSQMKRALDTYGPWAGQLSWSRNLYLFVFAVMVFDVGIVYSVLIISLPNRARKRDRTDYLSKLMTAYFVLTCWIPLRIYFDFNVKNVIQGSTESIGADLFYAFPFGVCGTIIALMETNLFDKYKNVVTIVAAISVPVVTFFKPSWLKDIVGINSHPVEWVISFLLLVLTAILLSALHFGNDP